MRLYLDDNCATPKLCHQLRKAGHDVQMPIDVGLRGKDDPIHLTHAIRESRVTLTRDYGDFDMLHVLLHEAKGHHPGMLILRRDRDTRTSTFPADVVRAIRKLEAAAVPITDEYIILNHWQ